MDNPRESSCRESAVVSTHSSTQSQPAEPLRPPEMKMCVPPKWLRPAEFDRRHVRDAARRGDGTLRGEGTLRGDGQMSDGPI